MKKAIFILLFYSSVVIGQGKLYTIDSKLIPETDSLLVFVPAQYTANDKLPCVILLHGYSGSYLQWSKNSNLQEYADIYRCMIVTPSGFFDSWYLNSPLLKNSQYAEYFKHVFLPYVVDSLKSDPQRIFISGLSMGGFGAVSLLLNNPKLLKAAASTSGVLNLVPFSGKWGLSKLFGNDSNAVDFYKKFSPHFLLDDREKFSNSLLIDCGTEDFAYQVNSEFYTKAVSLGYNITFISRPGSHTHQYWRDALPYHFLFFSKLF